MYRPRPRNKDADRRGVILLVVITLLTLFAVVGLTFVAYAESEATASRIYREANDVVPDYYQYLSEQDQPFDLALSQALYDVDDSDGIDSALRGHSFARAMYGWNDGFKTAGDPDYGNPNPNTIPFNGTGRLTDSSLNKYGQPDDRLVNYTYHRNDNFLRDPERTVVSAGQNYRIVLSNEDPKSKPRGLWTGGWNAPYTYPDTNNLFLAAVNANGQVLIPSFHRPWLDAGPLTTANGRFKANASNPPFIKYTTLRPLASEHRGFPEITVNGGDVQNIPNPNGLNDSVWIDLGGPVGTLPDPDGRRYKPMFAFLIRDLDGLVNVNQHGNVALNGNDHAVNQGWGKWEVNLKSVLNDPAALAEWQQIFLDGTYGRRVLGATSPAMKANLASWAQYDFDGSQRDGSNNRIPSAKLSSLMPGGPGNLFSSFPAFSGGYDSSDPSKELLNHPAAYNFLNRWPVDDLKGLIAYGPKDSTAGQPEWTNTELGKVLKNNLKSFKIRNLLTTLSADLDRAGAAPYAWDPSTTALQFFQEPTNANSNNWVPVNTTSFPSVASRAGAPPTGSEFRSDWRSNLAEANRINLNIDFTVAPWAFPPAVSGFITDYNAYNAALGKRQALVKTIFEQLQAATGAAALPASVPSPETPQFRANRWLAQLAVNIVDYLDSDDFMTPFNWFAGEYVYGTEMPRLVLNEVYVQLDNDPNDDGIKPDPMDPSKMLKATKYRLNVWAELHNPLKVEPTLSENGKAVLYRDATCAPYKLVVADANTTDRKKMCDPANVKGDPATDPMASGYPAKAVEVADLSPAGSSMVAPEVEPANGAFNGPLGKNKGFFLVAPDARFYVDEAPDPDKDYDPAAAPDPDPSALKSPTAKKTELSIPVAAVDKVVPNPTILLRRLACEHLPLNDPSLTTPPYDASKPLNPYITVDYVENVPWRDRLAYDNVGKHDPTAPADPAPMLKFPKNMDKQAAVGRSQPYASHISSRKNQAPAGVPNDGTRVLHTFFRHNTEPDVDGMGNPPAVASGGTLKVPFDWLVHLNRPVQNAAELMHVSGFKPSELTQQFMRLDVTVPATSRPARFAHEVRWMAANSPLHRFLELVYVPDRTNVAVPGGRVMGKININTIWDREVFHALAGGDPASAAAVDEVWNQLLNQRTQFVAPDQVGNTHRPFGSLAGGGPAGITNNSFLKPVNGESAFVPQTFAATDPNPYLKYEILRRIMNNTTVRSNVFAVWCTIGYFEVRDETTRPYILGPEIGSEVKRPFRSKFFAIVDRTKLALDPTDQTKQADKQPLYVPVNTSVQAGANVTIPTPPSGSNICGSWSLQPGNKVLVGVGMKGQTWATVGMGGTITIPTLSVDLQAPFGVLVPHAGDPVPVIPGNPGPQKDFKYTDAPWKGTVIQYFTDQLD